MARYFKTSDAEALDYDNPRAVVVTLKRGLSWDQFTHAPTRSFPQLGQAVRTPIHQCLCKECDQ